MLRAAAFPKHERITTKKEYQDIFERGARISGPFMKIHYTFGEKERKIGIIISRRIKGSIKRNRYKRILREAYRTNKEAIPSDMKIVVVVFRDIHVDNYETATKSLMTLVKKAGSNEKNSH